MGRAQRNPSFFVGVVMGFAALYPSYSSDSNFKMRVRLLAARSARGLRQLRSLRMSRGRREDRVRAAPAVSCAKCAQEHAHEHAGSAESIRPSPRNGFTAYNALSPATGLFATVVPEKRLLLTNLTPASGRQDHTISPSASATLVFVTPASTASHRAFRDDREPPLLSGETRGEEPLICPTRPAKYFCQKGWTDFFDLPVGQSGGLRAEANCGPKLGIARGVTLSAFYAGSEGRRGCPGQARA
jgi:hypothetical protein